jgi:hypothetical protein
MQPLCENFSIPLNGIAEAAGALFCAGESQRAIPRGGAIALSTAIF